MDERKQCQKCGSTLPLSEFYKHGAMRNGYFSKCKTCTKRDVRENRLARAEQYKEYERSRANLPHRVEARKEYSRTLAGRSAIARAKRKFIEQNPAKRKVHVICGNAIRDGLLTRQPCEVCGATAQAHHDDYSKPLDVRWLCTVHHAAWHKENTPLCPDQRQPVTNRGTF